MADILMAMVYCSTRNVKRNVMTINNILMTVIILSVEDLERNDGSPDKPYYMSRGLQKLLRKGNKEA